jgi:hypothetical protein
MEEFILLFTALGDIVLTEEKDTIAWKWSSTGDYSAASAYEIQFLGAYPAFNALPIWKALTEPKCCFFTWLAMHGKVPTVDNLMLKNWPCNPTCALCYCIPDTNNHLLTECNFTEAVWDRIAHSVQLHPSLIPFHKGDIANWLNLIGRAGTRKQQKEYAGFVFFFWWFIWKERNQIIFEQKECSFVQVAGKILDALQVYRRAFSP